MRNAFLKGLILGGFIFSLIGVSAANIAASLATYSNAKSEENVSNVSEALDELYSRIGPVFKTYTSNSYQLTRAIPHSNTAEVFEKYYYNYHDEHAIFRNELCVKNATNQVACFMGDYSAENTYLINFFGSENCTESSSSVTCNNQAQSLYCRLETNSITCSKDSTCLYKYVSQDVSNECP